MLALYKKYKELGWVILPLYGKKVFRQNWSTEPPEFSDSLEEIQTKQTNTGLLTGKKTGIFAIDVDDAVYCDYDPQPAIDYGAIAHTTSNGTRLVFASTNQEILDYSHKVVKQPKDLDKNHLTEKNQKKVDDDKQVTVIEYLGTGRQFMAPPSKHPDTKHKLEWITELKKPAEINEWTELKKLLGECLSPQVLTELFPPPQKPQPKERKGSDRRWQAIIDECKTVPMEDLISDLCDNVTQQQNYVKASCPLPGHADKDPSFVYYYDKDYWQCYVCNEFGDQIDLVIQSGEASNFNEAIEWLKDKYGLKFTIPKGKGRPKQTPTATELYREGKRNIIEDNKGRIKIDIHSMFAEIYSNYRIVTISNKQDHSGSLDKSGDRVYYWNEERQKWCNPIIDIVEPPCQDAWQELCRNEHVTQVMGMIRRKTRTPEDNLNRLPITLIPLRNGLLDVDNLELHEHTPEYFYTFQLPIYFKLGAECPKFQKFLDEVQPDQELQTKLQEFMGYCLWRDIRGTKLMEKAFLLIGPGGTGKSTFLNILKAMLGDENVTNLKLHAIENNKFASSQLEDIHANICNDISSNDLWDVSNFLRIVSGDSINVERKNMQGYDIQPFCKLIFACNEAPYSNVDTEAFYERWEIIPFNNKFRGTEQENKHMTEDITEDPEEMSGVFWFALLGLQRLREKGLTNPTYGEEAKDKFKMAASNVYQFGTEHLEPCPNGVIEKEVMYHDYQDFCSDLKLAPKPKKKFTEELQKYFPWILTNYKPTIGGKQRHAYGNVKYIGADPLYPDSKQQTGSGEGKHGQQSVIE